ncbi:MAG: BON domain-containing protein [Deltaproteobacteria bacterium]|nr:BON domain-containing protein [Deltaproteobacteria bacterium]
MKRVLTVLLLSAALAVLVSCAAARQPFASPADAALKQELTAALGPDYTRTLNITVSGGRVYMEGELRNQAELDEARAIIRGTQGVTSIMEDVFLSDVGPQGDNYK